MFEMYLKYKTNILLVYICICLLPILIDAKLFVDTQVIDSNIKLNYTNKYVNKTLYNYVFIYLNIRLQIQKM